MTFLIFFCFLRIHQFAFFILQFAFCNGLYNYFQTRIATSGQISPQSAQPVHAPLSSQTTKKYPCRLISSPIRINSFGQEMVQSPQPLHRSRSISILGISRLEMQCQMSKSKCQIKSEAQISNFKSPPQPPFAKGGQGGIMD